MSKNAYYLAFGFCGVNPQIPEIRQSLKLSALVQSEMKEGAETKILFSCLVIRLF